MKRIRISLRLMLLVTALCAVLFAWLGARRELKQVNTRGELERLQLYREYTLKSGPHNYTSEKAWRSSVMEMDELIEKKKQSLGEVDP